MVQMSRMKDIESFEKASMQGISPAVCIGKKGFLIVKMRCLDLPFRDLGDVWQMFFCMLPHHISPGRCFH